MRSSTSFKTDVDQRDRYRLLERIGKGSYGTVFKAIDFNKNIIIDNNNTTNTNVLNRKDINSNVSNSNSTSSDYNYNFVAIKIINLEDAADEIEQIHQEITIMSNISCPQLTKYYSSFVSGMSILISIYSMNVKYFNYFTKSFQIMS